MRSFGNEMPVVEERLGAPLPLEMPQPEVSAPRKIRIAYITSPRELEMEGVGYDERIGSTLGRLMERMRAKDPRFEGAELASIVVDDDGTERLGRVPGQGPGTTPSETFQYLQGIAQENGIDFCVEASGSWRRMPMYADAGKTLKNPARHEEKMAYEMRLLNYMRQHNIDVIVSDSYAVLFNSVMLSETMGYAGAIVNIHPAIASDNPGRTPTRDALLKARFFAGENGSERPRIVERQDGNQYFEFVQNAHTADLIGAVERLSGCAPVVENGRVYVPVGTRNFARAATGATMHVVDELVDHGPIILSSRATPIRRGDSEHDLRIRNYETKNQVFLNGLAQFIRRESTHRIISRNRVRNSAYCGSGVPVPSARQRPEGTPNMARARQGQRRMI